VKWLPILAAMLGGGCATPDAGADAPRARPTYSNPVLDSNFPDPALLKAADGNWYAYATQGEGPAGMANIQLARSRDLIMWNRLGDALPRKPAWAATTQDFWAPDIGFRGGRYFLYYSARPDPTGPGEEGLCLAVATADQPAGPFIDSGRPLLCGTGFEAIDPFAFDDPATGKRLLYWGSGFGPIKVQELAPDRLGLAPGSQPVDLVHPIATADAGTYQRLVEAATVVLRDGWYYLFFSGDNCCGSDAHYAVMVARSRSATGPFETLAQASGRSDSVILKRSARWIAPGHTSVVQDGSGGWWLIYHAVDARRPQERASDPPNSRRVMLMDRIIWDGGWPRIADDSPSDGRRTAPTP
jgi:arabinan endo-1,5-alpha-L-arabinosidase